MKRLLKVALGIFLGLWIVTGGSAGGQALVPRIGATIKVYDLSIGTSTRYIGAVEGNVNFDRADLQDLGINTYRIYGGMSRWESQDDDGIYGSPSIAEIKANPNVINWEWWDNAMTNPPNGSDYWWSGLANQIWQGNAHTLFGTLKDAKIRPVLTIRNTDDSWHPDWALQLNPPQTQADWNEWWEHVFATVYWLNVRNDYQVNDFEIHNEPDVNLQGWGGTQADYFELAKVARDAIDHVYKTYLPDRTYYIHASVTIENSRWVYDALQSIPTFFESINIHNYANDISSYIQQVHRWMNRTVHANSPVWLGEWGTYTGGYDDLSFSLNLIKNLIRASQPGETYVYGSHLFSLYDWGHEGTSKGVIDWEGNRRLSYYAFRMGIRALQGARLVFSSTISSSEMMGIVTGDNQGNFYLLMVNDQAESETVTADVSNLMVEGTGTVWEFSETVKDEIVMHMAIEQGTLTLQIPAYSSRLVTLYSRRLIDS